ncbi:hypothetical protein L6452_07025 [Arctium lappa]|uniref:Uncharacterized protein n=1 Tax=Arctium lappa TaxID=4217 RepID=A0ACB9EKE5_ARCLA|nr:hypothetical protein L6452_07025 [Arctium lappa]
MKGITLNEGLKERINGTRVRLRSNDTKAEDKMKIENESVIDAGMEKGVRIPKREVHLPVIRTRTSPRALYDAIHKLNNEQQEVVKSMGMECLLGIKINGIPFRPATLAWNVELLKKQEIAEIENGGLGSAPLLDRTQDPPMNNNKFTPLHDDSVEPGLEDLEREREVRDIYASTTETVFDLDKGASLMRGNFENLAKPSAVFPHVVDGWAEDHDLWTPFIDFKSQYEIFSRNLAILARFNMEVLKMRNMDLVDMEENAHERLHMETWMGDEWSWKTGFTKEGPNQKIQLKDLRKKFVAKLVLSNFNKKKEDVLKEVEANGSKTTCLGY